MSVYILGGGGLLPHELTGQLPPYLPEWGRDGTPILPDGGGVPPSQVRMGGGCIPILGHNRGRGVPHVQVRTGGTPNRNSTACTCCAAGSMPLAFTQEDFLVAWTDSQSISSELQNEFYTTIPPAHSTP